LVADPTQICEAAVQRTGKPSRESIPPGRAAILPLPSGSSNTERKARPHPLREPMLSREVASELIIARVEAQTSLHPAANRLQFLISKYPLLRIRTLHIHNLDDLLRQTPDKSFPARFDHYRIAATSNLFTSS